MMLINYGAGGFRRFLHLSFINQFSKMWHILTSTIDNKKGAKIQLDTSRFYQKVFFFLKYKNKAEFTNLDDYEILSSDFPGLRMFAVSMTSTASTRPSLNNLHGLNDLDSLISSKKYWSWWFDHPWHPNDQHWSLLMEWIIKNSNFYWYLPPLCQRLLRLADITFLKTDKWSH